ncbi:similar to Saccharomyces cerevisiae YIL155C GUT2 Mitochondrial glycerol-3-phosphate dehydrogenase [Maudiozyma saulgeensis]|uniref:Glycerol-3-phosphate dehydrogenase n=1 Tax=Maudiozyma saulgeensis TaxID=1789683 RepID=A0A1X7QWV4_9SACH|nr:similar to Saccharomyces cerevisiae YIL155C GUT2 Mitochondrial glycerol-3-phosphate dehydrogenase [Kazachstania saulgeensis]
MFATAGKRLLKPKVFLGVSSITILGGSILYFNAKTKKSPLADYTNLSPVKTLESVAVKEVSTPSRETLLDKLSSTPQFDVLIIGGGATGTGCAVDAATRGLNVALVEKADFASGTSSKSTKMAHGGVRYLEKAFLEFSKDQLDLVVEALNERAHLINTAPHLCKILPILIPVYTYWQIPYFYAGCKFYDLFAGSQNLKSSYLLSKSSAAELAPMLDSSKLTAGLVYHDGSFNDSRLNSTLAITAISKGATVLNYMQVQQLIKDEKDIVKGAIVKDVETNKIYEVMAKTTVNATGPYSDHILQMDNNKNGLPDIDSSNYHSDDITQQIAVKNPKMVVPSSGVHIILPSFYCPKNVGLLDVRTSDGRVMFFLPWQGKVLAGTTDIPLKQVPETPTATEADIQDILKELQHYIKFPVKRDDVLSAWAGIRPLVKDPRIIENEGGKTEGLVRSHFIFTSPSNLITIAGGKWTTYREMAEETVNEVVKVGNFKDINPCSTRKLKLIGAEHWNPNLEALLAQKYNLSSKMAQHLADNYGTRAPLICESFKQNNINQLPVTLATNFQILSEKAPSSNSNEVDTVADIHIIENNEINPFDSFRYPFTIGELKYSIQHEYTRTALDFLLRRTRFAFLDARQALNAVDGTVKIMGDELKWDDKRRSKEIEDTKRYIKTFGV